MEEAQAASSRECTKRDREARMNWEVGECSAECQACDGGGGVDHNHAAQVWEPIPQDMRHEGDDALGGMMCVPENVQSAHISGDVEASY